MCVLESDQLTAYSYFFPQNATILMQTGSLLLKLSKTQYVKMEAITSAEGNRCAIASGYRSIATSTQPPTAPSSMQLYLSPEEQYYSLQCLIISGSRESVSDSVLVSDLVLERVSQMIALAMTVLCYVWAFTAHQHKG